MKSPRYNKVLGLAVGERSIVVAEVATTDAQRPDAKRLAEFVYPEGAGLTDPVALGKALNSFLKENRFGARHAVVGLPAKWLLVKTKEVPPADDSTIADMLRLQAEGEFSSELKDLVYDYTGQSGRMSQAHNVLLVATPRKYIDLATQLCEAARVDPIAITISAAALGAATGRNVAKNAVVLTLATGGAELTAQSGEIPNTLRHLRAPAPEALFLSDLRRAVSTIPPNGSARELVVWDGSGNGNATAHRLADSLGMQVRNGDLPSLGVTTTEATSNGGGRIFAPAVALALTALSAQLPAVDFLHSRLAPPVKRRVAPWMIWTAIAAMLAIGLGVYGYVDLQIKEAALTKLKADLDQDKEPVKVAQAFVDKVSFADKWHGTENPRYVSCMLDVTRLVPDDYYTYATSVVIKDKEDKLPQSGGKAAAVAAPATRPSDRPLIVTFYGKAPDQDRAVNLYRTFQANSKGRFIDLKFLGTQIVGVAGGGRSTEVSFSFSCTYVPPDQRTVATK